MKISLISKDLRKKYNPDLVYTNIKKVYKDNLKKLKLSLGHKNSPLIKYNQNLQMSFLDGDDSNIEDLIKEVANTLGDTIFFMLLSKKDRTLVSKNMRLYLKSIAENQLERIKILLNDSEIGLIKEIDNPLPKHKGMEIVYSILGILKLNIELELKRWKSLPRIGYLTGLQISMGGFFQKLKAIGMSQKDQITQVQKLFDDFKVDWSEVDRENIKVSIQKPAIYYQKINDKYKKEFIESSFSKFFSDDLIINFIDHAMVMQKRFRRF